jgi:hypothetical protein
MKVLTNEAHHQPNLGLLVMKTISVFLLVKVALFLIWFDPMKYVVMSMRMMLAVDIKIRELRSICHANLELA